MNTALEEYLETLKRLTGAKTDAELAAAIGKAKQTVSSWRRRGDVPCSVQYELVDRYGPEAGLYPEIKHVSSEREKQAILAVYLSLFDQHRSILDPFISREHYISWAQAFLHCEDDIRSAIRSLGFLGPGDNQFTVAEMIKAMIDTGKLPAVHEALEIWLDQKSE